MLKPLLTFLLCLVLAYCVAFSYDKWIENLLLKFIFGCIQRNLTFGGTSFYLLFVEFYTNKIITNVLYFPTEKFEQYLLNLLV